MKYRSSAGRMDVAVEVFILCCCTSFFGLEIPSFADGLDAGKRSTPFYSGIATRYLTIGLR